MVKIHHQRAFERNPPLSELAVTQPELLSRHKNHINDTNRITNKFRIIKYSLQIEFY